MILQEKKEVHKLDVAEIRLMRGITVVESVKVEPNYLDIEITENVFHVRMSHPLVFKIPRKGIYRLEALNAFGTVMITWPQLNGLRAEKGDTITLSN